ncbi:MAG: PfkB family carbohydrate kinase [Planctomycetota bacterium]
MLWETLFPGGDAAQAASGDVDRILEALGETAAVEASGVAVRVRVTREYVGSTLLPLATAFRKLVRERERRVLVGVAGGAGTGKTVLCSLLCRVLDVLEGQEVAVTLSMDGYHFSNAYLDTHFTIERGEEVPLRQLKGRPPTIDVAAFVADLQRLRSSSEGEIALPVYDRGRHDPVPAGLCVHPQHRVVLVEGLHLLRAEGRWDEIRSGLDCCILLDLPLEACRRRVVARKVAGGRTLTDASAHFERVDLPTLEELRDPALRARADLVIRMAGDIVAADPELPPRLQSCERRESLAERVELREVPQDTIHLLAVGLNPALQKTLVFERWERGRVSRASEALTSVGGKGQQFARAANRLIPGDVTVAQFLGGENGERVGRIIAADGVHQLTVPVSGETRTCITLVDSTTGEATELVEPSAEVQPCEAEQLLSRILQALVSGKIDGLALCGTYPPGVSEEFYATIAPHKGKALLLLDAWKGIERTLGTGKVDILKVNAEELRTLAGRWSESTGEGPAKGNESIQRAAGSVFAAYNLRWIAVTAGAKTAWLFEKPRVEGGRQRLWSWPFFEFRLPVLEGVVNPIGAGDTVGAIFLAQLAAGAPAHAAFACGLAAASASCRRLCGADFELSDLREILARIEIARITRCWTDQEAG